MSRGHMNFPVEIKLTQSRTKGMGLNSVNGWLKHVLGQVHVRLVA